MADQLTNPQAGAHRPGLRRWPHRVKVKPRRRSVVIVTGDGVTTLPLPPVWHLECPGCPLHVHIESFNDAQSAASDHFGRCPGLRKLNEPHARPCWACNGVPMRLGACIVCEGSGVLPR